MKLMDICIALCFWIFKNEKGEKGPTWFLVIFLVFTLLGYDLTGFKRKRMEIVHRSLFGLLDHLWPKGLAYFEKPQWPPDKTPSA